MNFNRSLKTCLNFAIVLAFIVVSLGAYTRLTDAGLGCPDWPGCYGQLRLPAAGEARDAAQALYPTQQIEASKAWTEMIHRYVAGGLVVLVLLSLGLSIRARLQAADFSLKLPVFISLWIVFQALLGMWTVTWKLLPLVVMSHLLSGAILFCALVLFRVQLAGLALPPLGKLRFALSAGLFIVFIQMALGAWVSTNYAGIACVGFPTCNGQWWPLDSQSVSAALEVLTHPVGLNYQGGVLSHEGRVAIQVIHRFGALITFLYTLFFISLLWIKVHVFAWRKFALLLFALLMLQVLLGILNVIYFLPLPIAVLHNVVAVLFFSTYGAMRYAS